MTVYEAVGRGSIPRRGTESFVLGVCRIRTRLCEGRRPGSIPGWIIIIPEVFWLHTLNDLMLCELCYVYVRNYHS